MPQRLAEIEDWLRELGWAEVQLAPASADASFRRYWRAVHAGESHIVMDAPPQHEDCRPWIRLARQLADIGLNVPRVLAQDLTRGYVLISDLGTQPYLGALDDRSADRLYGDALAALAVLQAGGPGESDLPPYDRGLLLREMALFRDWYLLRHRGLVLGESEEVMLADSFGWLADAALAQPRVCVHRDYHSRNLMLTPACNPGILDFQDAVHGPVTYDVVSLLKDCYIAWPRERVLGWVRDYHGRALRSGLLSAAAPQADEARFIRDFDLMGVQRHLKASGIFARLNHRDGKPGYLADIPRTLQYILDLAPLYRELAPLTALIERHKDW
jgi:hypothetical protein